MSVLILGAMVGNEVLALCLADERIGADDRAPKIRCPAPETQGNRAFPRLHRLRRRIVENPYLDLTSCSLFENSRHQPPPPPGQLHTLVGGREGAGDRRKKCADAHFRPDTWSISSPRAERAVLGNHGVFSERVDRRGRTRTCVSDCLVPRVHPRARGFHSIRESQGPRGEQPPVGKIRFPAGFARTKNPTDSVRLIAPICVSRDRCANAGTGDGRCRHQRPPKGRLGEQGFEGLSLG